MAGWLRAPGPRQLLEERQVCRQRVVLLTAEQAARRSIEIRTLLVAERCGQYGTLLVGIDRNGQNAEMFAIDHVNGTATVINELHWVDGEFADPVYFRMTGRPDLTPPLNGE